MLCQAAIAKGVFVCLATGKARPAAIKAMTKAGLAGGCPHHPSRRHPLLLLVLKALHANPVFQATLGHDQSASHIVSHETVMQGIPEIPLAKIQMVW